MDINFKQTIVITLISGVFVLLGAYISSTQNSDKKQENNVSYVGPTYSYASGTNSSATSNVNVSIKDNRVTATNGSTVIQDVHGSNIIINKK